MDELSSKTRQVRSVNSHQRVQGRSGNGPGERRRQISQQAEVARTAYPDHTSWDSKSKYFDAASTPENPRWSMVDVRFVAEFPRVVTLDEIKHIPELSDMILVQRSRLSVQPVEPQHYQLIVRLAGT